MKLIKAKVYYTRKNEVTTYSGGYPKAWVAEKIPYIVYGEKGNDGRDFQWMIAIVQDEIYQSMLDDPQCEAVSKADAVVFSNIYQLPKDKITDKAKVLEVLSKVKNKQLLTKEDEEVIDPENPRHGIKKGRSLEDFCERYGVTE